MFSNTLESFRRQRRLRKQEKRRAKAVKFHEDQLYQAAREAGLPVERGQRRLN